MKRIILPIVYLTYSLVLTLFALSVNISFEILFTVWDFKWHIFDSFKKEFHYRKYNSIPSMYHSGKKYTYFKSFYHHIWGVPEIFYSPEI